MLAAAEVDELIAAIQVQERTDTTDADVKAAKDAWDALTDAQKALVEEGGYFADDTLISMANTAAAHHKQHFDALQNYMNSHK